MMVCAALMDQRAKPEYSSLLSNPISPSVDNLKVWIEEAWKSGEYLPLICASMPLILSRQVLTPRVHKS
jgi:hypothetical protein